MKVVDTDKPKILYHYTTQEGLIGIVSQKSIWATKTIYLNDASELSRPLYLTGEVLKNIKEEIVKRKMKVISNIVNNLAGYSSLNICVASFCTDGDLLSQWRGYGSYGLAYSIGFDTNMFEEDANSEKFELTKCIYYEEGDYVVEINKFVKGIVEEQIKNNGDFEFGSFIEKVIKKAVTMKLKCFEEENEWRIVSIDAKAYTDAKFNFRTGKSMIIPYFDMPFRPSSIARIVIGPCQHPELTKRAIEGLTLKYGIKNIAGHYADVLISKIPYRVF
jgi:hypothetical protein